MANNQRKAVKRDLRAELTERLMAQMENGEAFWQRPWERGEVEAPHNAITGKPYRGVNSQNLMLTSPDPSDNRWCTYKQAETAGWQVKKGEHGTQIEKWSEYTHKLTEAEIQKAKESGIANPDPEEKRMSATYYTVFHASQIDGIPARERPDVELRQDNEVDARLPKLAENLGVSVQHSGTRAFYRASDDRVNLPPVEMFKSGKDHDTVFLHELSHSTGSKTRMNRGLSGSFGSESYAKEELRAELSAAMTAMSLGLGFSPDAQQQEEGREVVSGVDNTAAYLTSWLKALPEADRKKELMGAISEAQKISDYLVERTPELEKGLDKELVQFVQDMTRDDKDSHLEAIRDAARLKPDQAVRWAEELRSNPHEYAQAAGPDVLHADNMRGVATQLEIGSREIEKNVEVEKQVGKEHDMPNAHQEPDTSNRKPRLTDYVLTSRKDLPERMNYNDVLYKPVQSISGKTTHLGIGERSDSIRMEGKSGEHIWVRLDRGDALKGAFDGVSKDDAHAIKHYTPDNNGRDMTISIADDDKTITIAVEGIKPITHVMRSNAIHKTLMNEALIYPKEGKDHYEGVLKGVYGRKLEVHTKDGPTLLTPAGDDIKPAFSDTTAKKLLNKHVEVDVHKDGRVHLKSLEIDKNRGR